MTRTPNDPGDRERLVELLDELENVRTGRRVRRRATAGLAVVAILATVAVLAWPNATPQAPVAPPVAVNPQPIAPSTPDPAPPSMRIEIVDTAGTLAHIEIAPGDAGRIEIMSDGELARALRETGAETGVATYNGRTVLTSSSGADAREDRSTEGTTF